MSAYPTKLPNYRALPLVLRLAGLWIVWSAWCSVSGWLLSSVHQLNGYGYAALLPALLAFGWFWLRSTAPASPVRRGSPKRWLRHLRQPLSLVYFLVVVSSLLAGLWYEPWSSDATLYRLPRVFYWWFDQHWHWIGTVDHRLDYNSLGFEWQMLPLIIGSHSDRGLFLLNWLPFLLMPGMVFLAFRTLGVGGRVAHRWMWLLPCGYCFALQCSGPQNDGYAALYVLTAVVMAKAGLSLGRSGLILMAVLATALLTGAKLSNLPLLLPLGILLWPALPRLRWFGWRVPAVLIVAVVCSFLPLAFECWKHTGDWSGDPEDEWKIKTHGSAGAIAANVIILLNESLQPPFLPSANCMNGAFDRLNQSSFFKGLKTSHGQFSGVRFGNMAYESGAGLGIGLSAYTAFLLAGAFVVNRQSNSTGFRLPWKIRWTPWLAWIAYGVFLAKLGSSQSARIAAPYYPLILVPLLRYPAASAFERKKWMGGLAVFAAAAVLPVILLTPARPLVPVQTVARILNRPALDKIAEQYIVWKSFRDSLTPLRSHLPADALRVGYAGGFAETPYSLFQPFGHRIVVELGLSGESYLPLPSGLTYAVVSKRGLSDRYQTDLTNWLVRVHGQVVFTLMRLDAFDTHTTTNEETWYLVKLNPPATNHLDPPQKISP